MKTTQDIFFERISEQKAVRSSVRAIIIHDNKLLVQIPSDDIHGIHAFIGGTFEYGDTFESRIRAEINEETNAKVLKWEYLFVVDNKFYWNGNLVHGLDHFLLVEIDRTDIVSKEAHLIQKWIPLERLVDIDLKPKVVKELILSDKLFETKYVENI